jgi:hypothetical protein
LESLQHRMTNINHHFSLNHDNLAILALTHSSTVVEYRPIWLSHLRYSVPVVLSPLLPEKVGIFCFG